MFVYINSESDPSCKYFRWENIYDFTNYSLLYLMFFMINRAVSYSRWCCFSCWRICWL